MTKTKGKKAHWFIAVPIILLFILFYPSNLSDHLKNSYSDFLFNLRLSFWGIQKVDKRLVLAKIDDSSIAELGKVPWPRSIHAKLIEELMRYQPTLIVFDVLFTEPDKRYPEEDRALVAATKKWKGHLVHALYESIGSAGEGELSLPQISVLKPFKELLSASQFVGFVDDQKLKGNDILSTKDPDGAMRKVFLSKQTADGETVLSLSAIAFSLLKNITVEDFVKSYPDEIRINFPGIYRTATQSGKIIEDEPYLEISIANILSKKLKAEQQKQLKGSVVFVASVATGYYDHFPTPYRSMAPGVSMHMYALNSLLMNNHLKNFSNLATVILMLLLGLLVAVAVERYSALTNLFILLATLTGLIGLSIYLFVYKNLIMDALIPSISSFAIFASGTLYRIATEEKEKRWIRSTFSQYLSPKVVSLLVENPDALKLGGEKRLMTVLFLDIAHFTTLSEKLTPENLTKVLNHYLTIFTDITMKHEGVVDKFIGDCVMAFWNAPFEQPQHSLQACLAALEMRQKTREVQPEGIPRIDVRVGVHTGYMIVGNMGSLARFNYTVVGDNVNFASRLEGANKFFKSAILISEVTHELCKEHVVARELGSVRVVGKEIPVGVYELLGKKNGEIADIQNLKIWKSAIEALKKGECLEAKTQLKQYLAIHAGDPTAMNYLHMIEEGRKKDFVINLTEK